VKLTFTKSHQPKTETLFPNKLTPKFSLKDIQDKRDYRRIKILVDNKVPFYPPTMCPAGADIDAGELESLKWALDYYKKAGLQEVCIQRKMMGSRCVVALRNSPEESFAISKNGFLINHVDLTSEINRIWRRMLYDKSWYVHDGEQLLIDCELMPWSALGKKLIDKNFYGYAQLVENEVSNCEGFEYALLKLSEIELDKDLPQHIKKSVQLSKFIENNTCPPTLSLAYLKKFRQALSNYDQEYPPEIKPFQIIGRNADDSWNFFNEDGMTVVSVDDAEKAYAFRNSMDVDTTEGVVVKPIQPVRNIAPYLKVRNTEYLRIVYGPDYDESFKLNKLMHRKRINNKLKTSIKQWNACLDMLEGANIENVLCNLLHSPEPEMDPRL
jgi:hypothetical protein